MRRKKDDTKVLISDSAIFKETDTIGNVITWLCSLVTLALIVLGIITFIHIL